MKYIWTYISKNVSKRVGFDGHKRLIFRKKITPTIIPYYVQLQSKNGDVNLLFL